MQVKEFDVALSTAIFEAKEVIKKDNNWSNDMLCIDRISAVPEISDILVFTFKNWPVNDNTQHIVRLQRAVSLNLAMAFLFKSQLEINKAISKEHMLNEVDCFILSYLQSKQKAIEMLKCSEDELQIDANSITFNYNNDKSYVKEVKFRYYTDQNSVLLGYYDRRYHAI